MAACVLNLMQKITMIKQNKKKERMWAAMDKAPDSLEDQKGLDFELIERGGRS